VGLLLVVVLAVALFGVRVAWARAASTPHVVAPGASGSAVAARSRGPAGSAGADGSARPDGAAGPDGAGGSGFASASAATAPSGAGGPPPTASGVVTVHIVGQVARAGLLRLPAGSRVADAVAAAGGARAGADLAAINLARVLADGEQVRVPKVGEAPVVTPGSGQSSGSGAGGAGAGGPLAHGLVNLNTASIAELDGLPGVGPVLAQRIVDWRTEHGRFASVDELGEVSGIGEKIFAQLRPKVTV
jgi:competence protein ComEA